MDAQTTGSNPTMPFVIALAHQKGGVGKTTSSSGLAASLAGLGHRTLVIDLDPSGNLTAGLGVLPESVDASAAEVLRGDASAAHAVIPTAVAGLDLLPSGPGMLTLSRYLYRQSGYEHLLRAVLSENSMRRYRFVVIDCPPMLEAATITALTATNLALIPTQCEYYSLQGLESVFQLIRVVREKTNPLLRYRLLITMFDQRGALHRRILSHIQTHYQSALMQTVIGFDSKVRESQMVGEPVTEFSPRTRAALQYRCLAEELQTYVEKQTIQPA